jgi:membrane protein YdbS with pleckstrin-like domain
MESLHPRVRVRWALGVLVSAAVVAGVLVAVGRFVSTVPLWPLAAVLAVLGLGHAVLRYRRWGFEVGEDALYLERGVITAVATSVPFVRVQHVDTRRGPLDRVLGLASVVVYTAGSRGADVTIPGLTRDRAAELQTRLKRLTIASEEEDAV